MMFIYAETVGTESLRKTHYNFMMYLLLLYGNSSSHDLDLDISLHDLDTHNMTLIFHHMTLTFYNRALAFHHMALTFHHVTLTLHHMNLTFSPDECCITNTRSSVIMSTH